MKRYQPMQFRPSFGVTALALSALTMTLAVGVPSGMSNADATMAARWTRDGTWVTIDPAHVDAVGVRETDVALSPARPAARRG